MIEPYKTVFVELAPLLERLGFSKERDDSQGASFIRKNSHRLLISIERFSPQAFGAELEKIGGDPQIERFSPKLLMEALEPTKALVASQAIDHHGYNEEGIFRWWNIFLTFLLENEGVVFELSPSGSHWEAYVHAFNREVEEFKARGMTGLPEIKKSGTGYRMVWPSE